MKKRVPGLRPDLMKLNSQQLQSLSATLRRRLSDDSYEEKWDANSCVLAGRLHKMTALYKAKLHSTFNDLLISIVDRILSQMYSFTHFLPHVWQKVLLIFCQMHLYYCYITLKFSMNKYYICLNSILVSENNRPIQYIRHIMVFIYGILLTEQRIP